MKLKNSDINLKTEGEQARHALEERYGSVERFAEAVNSRLYVHSIKSYLRRSHITSETLKTDLTVGLGRDYSEIVLTKKSQVSRYVDMVWDNIKEYKDKEDIEVLDHLMRLCRHYSLPSDRGRMYRAIGLHHFYRGEYPMALTNLEMAITIFHDRLEWKREFICISDMALVYNYQEAYQKGLEMCEKANAMLRDVSDIDDMTLFLHYYRWGILLNNMKEQELARAKFEFALGIAPEKYYEANTLMQIGLSYKRQKKYTPALQQYSKALERFEDDEIEHIAIVYNNIAEVYRLKKDYDTALCILDKAFNMVNGVECAATHLCFQTYVQIKALKGETDIALNRLLNMTSRMEKTYSYRKFFIQGIKLIIDTGKNDKQILEAVIEILTKTALEDNSGDSEYMDKLKFLLGDATICLKSI